MPNADDTTQTEQPIEEWRAEEFERLKFTPTESKKLAKAEDSTGWLVQIADVRQALENGCTHRMAIKIFT